MKSLIQIEAAVSRRQHLDPSITAFRLVDGVGDEIDNLLVDKFQDVALIHLLEADGFSGNTNNFRLEDLRACAADLQSLLGVASVYLWNHQKGQAAKGDAQAELLSGAPRDEFQITEGKLSWLVNPCAQRNAGLFLDTRDIRHDLACMPAFTRVLNTFCFTGTLGIATLIAGAKEVVQVDISKAALRWAKRNLDLNQAKVSGEMRFICEDSLKFMAREQKRRQAVEDKYDLIIIDPPSFSSSGGVRFDLKKQFPELMSSALSILRPGGQLILTCNYRSLDSNKIESLLKECVGKSKLTLQKCKSLHAPVADFTSTPEDSYSVRGVWANFR